MFARAGERGWGKGPGKLPSFALWVSGEGERGPLLNLTSAARSWGAGAARSRRRKEPLARGHRDRHTNPALATATSSKEPQLCKPLAVPSTRYKEKEIKPTMPQDAFDSTPGSCGEFRTFLCGGKTMGKASGASRGERGSAGEPAAQGPAAAEKH